MVEALPELMTLRPYATGSTITKDCLDDLER
uniref:Uncharacterized protein n=1 Tax=Tetranychus urticae TaxID=32264 RepID=T1KR06_TETUR